MLSADKQYLVESRLCRWRANAGFAGSRRTGAKLKVPGAEPLVAEVVDAMTTNESFFFRDKIPFEHFRETIMPALLARARREAASAYLVRGRSDRTGAVLVGDGSEGTGQGA